MLGASRLHLTSFRVSDNPKRARQGGQHGEGAPCRGDGCARGSRLNHSKRHSELKTGVARTGERGAAVECKIYMYKPDMMVAYGVWVSLQTGLGGLRRCPAVELHSASAWLRSTGVLPVSEHVAGCSEHQNIRSLGASTATHKLYRTTKPNVSVPPSNAASQVQCGSAANHQMQQDPKTTPRER